MELVYLWVEKYKNIENCGFNFSHRFKCEFKSVYKKDENGEKVLDENKSELIICDKSKKECEDNDYIENFFGNNINITAIVGKNGSGKSSVLESFLDLSMDLYQSEDVYRKYILIYKHQNKFFILKKHINDEIGLYDKNKNLINWIEHNPNDKLLTWHNDMNLLYLSNEIINKAYEQKNNIFIENSQGNKNKIKKMMLSNHITHNINLAKIDNKYFSPNKVNIKLKLQKLQEDESLYKNEINEKIKNIIKEINESLKPYDIILKILEILKLRQDKKNFKSEIPFYSPYSNRTTSLQIQSKDQYSSKLDLGLGDYGIDEIYSNLLKNLKQTERKNKNLFYSFKVDELNEEHIDFLFDLPELVFDIELVEDNIKFEDLSFGERQLLAQLHSILFYSKQKKYKSIEIVPHEYNENNEEVVEHKLNSMFILIDEFEVGLHPQWQKKAINYIIEFLESFNIKFQILITSHSPFLLSDIPKQNIIFLDKDEKGNCKVVDGLNEKKQTFGANIHTLLSDGFFMEDGLMGEFAKNKIQEIMDFLNDKKSIDEISTKEEDVRKVIEGIGEPFLREKLLQKYYQKFKDEASKKARKDELIAKQKWIEEELKKL